jgi:integrase
MLKDTELRSLKPRTKPYKVSDRLGLYVQVSQAGTKSFRFDYRFEGKRQTLTIGRYAEGLSSRTTEQLDQLRFGSVVSLADARHLLDRARRMLQAGMSPAKQKIGAKEIGGCSDSFGEWAARYFEFKSDPKSGEEMLAESTLSLKRSIFRRFLEPTLAVKDLEGIRPPFIADLLRQIKERNGPGPAIHARELIGHIYRFAIGQGQDVTNPIDTIQRKTIATFKARERNLTRHEIKEFFDALENTRTASTLRLAIKFMLLTGVRKGEFIQATWKEVDWERATWTIPAARMKAGKAHVVYLSDQALNILTTFQTCFPSTPYFHPSRHESYEPISNATLNRSIDAAVKVINQSRGGEDEFETFSVHDLRRTFSTRLNEALFPEALIELCLAHVKKDQVAAAYNHAKLPGPRKALMQGWADMIDKWCDGESAREIVVATKANIERATHDDTDVDL